MQQKPEQKKRELEPPPNDHSDWSIICRHKKTNKLFYFIFVFFIALFPAAAAASRLVRCGRTSPQFAVYRCMVPVATKICKELECSCCLGLANPLPHAALLPALFRTFGSSHQQLPLVVCAREEEREVKQREKQLQLHRALTLCCVNLHISR